VKKRELNGIHRVDIRWNIFVQPILRVLITGLLVVILSGESRQMSGHTDLLPSATKRDGDGSGSVILSRKGYFQDIGWAPSRFPSNTAIDRSGWWTLNKVNGITILSYIESKPYNLRNRIPTHDRFVGSGNLQSHYNRKSRLVKPAVLSIQRTATPTAGAAVNLCF
jgi:hypothetical protein